MIPTQNRPHALLVTGQPEAVLPTLKAEIKGLLCEGQKTDCGPPPPLRRRAGVEGAAAENAACGKCASCHLFESEAGHPDVMILIPEGKMNLIKIDSIREVIAFLSQTSMRGGLRVVLLTEADALNIASQNALLKSLEEPGEKALIILLTDKPHLLLPTIKSRCQRIKQKGLPHAHLEELAAQLVFPQSLIASLAVFKDIPLTELIETKMRILYDAISLRSQLPHAGLHFPDLHVQINEYTKNKTIMDLHRCYDFLIEKKQLLQKQVALNPELMLAQLFLYEGGRV